MAVERAHESSGETFKHTIRDIMFEVGYNLILSGHERWGRLLIDKSVPMVFLAGGIDHVQSKKEKLRLQHGKHKKDPTNPLDVKVAS